MFVDRPPERRAECLVPQPCLEQVHAMHVEKAPLGNRRRVAVDRRRHVPPLEDRQRVLRNVLEPIVKGHDRDRLREVAVRIHQGADGRAREVLLEDAQFAIELFRRDRFGALEKPLARMAVVIADDQRVPVAQLWWRRLRFEIERHRCG